MFFKILLALPALRLCSSENAFLNALLNKDENEAQRLLKEGNLTDEELGGEPNSATTPLIVALQNYPKPYEEIALALIEKKGVRLRLSGRTAAPEWNTVLHESVKRRMPLVVKALLSTRKGRELLEVKNGYGLTALQLLVANKISDRVDKFMLLTLLDADANVNAETDTFTPLHATASNFDAHTARLLLAKGAEVDAEYVKNGAAATPLQYILTFDDDTRMQLECVVAYVNYGAKLTVKLSEELLRRFWKYPRMLADARIVDSFDELFLKISSTLYPSPYLSDLISFHDNRGSFALFRIMNVYWGKPINSVLEKYQRDILLKADSEYESNLVTRKWELARFAWNMAVATLIKEDDTYGSIIRIIRGNQFELMGLYVLRNSLTEDKRSLSDEESWDYMGMFGVPRINQARRLISRFSAILGEPEEKLWKYIRSNYCPAKMEDFSIISSATAIKG